MEGLMFLAECIGIGLILLWIVQNDTVGLGDRTSGLFAMRSKTPEDKLAADPRQRMRQARPQVQRTARR